jgi:hypothetical protein
VIGVAALYLMGALASSPSADPVVRFLAGVGILVFVAFFIILRGVTRGEWGV